MSLWEYKVITSGKGGFATPAMLEKYLNDLGREEWEIIHFHSPADNALAFTGLVRRSTQRDWTLQDAAAAAAKAEADKLRVEFEAKFRAGTSAAPAAAESASPSLIEEKASPDDGFRKPVDTSRDGDSDASEEEGEKDEWDKLASEDELPTFFDALKPHMRRNQRGPGMSVGVDYLAKKWDMAEGDVKGALVECGMQIPADEDAKPVFVEYDGDQFWVNINRRGEIWINTREKPRPVFRVVQATKVAVEEPAPKPEVEHRAPVHTPAATFTPTPKPAPADAPAPAESAPAPSGAALPEGLAMLDRIRPLMRRNRRGPGGSGSTSFLARALKCSEPDLIARFVALGLVLPASANDKPHNVELAGDIWWINLDSRGGVWINGREKRGDENVSAPAPTAEVPAPTSTLESTPVAEPAVIAAAPVAESAPAPAASSDNTLSAVRLLLKETKTGSVAGKVDRLSEELNKSTDDFVAALVAAGLKVPEKSREKPVFVEHAGEIFWLNKNAKDELWLNAKASKFSDGGEEAKPKRTRSKKGE